jgi:hypothetical protein
VTAKLELAFVAVGALLGIELIGRNTEHIVALTANPVNENRSGGGGERARNFPVFGQCGRSGVSHGGILSRVEDEAGSDISNGAAGI